MAVYQRPSDPDCPVLCLDETSKQLIGETRVPIPAKSRRLPGTTTSTRNGANLIMLFAALEGWRHLKVADRHASVDYAQVLENLADTHLPDARRIALLQDNPNTHKAALLHQDFPAVGSRPPGREVRMALRAHTRQWA